MTKEPSGFVLRKGNRFISVDLAGGKDYSCAVMGRVEDGRIVIERVKYSGDEEATASEDEA